MNAVIEKIKSLMGKSPDSPQFARLAEEMRLNGQPQKAIQFCQAGLKNRPGYATGFYVLARSYIDDNNTEKARDALVDALRFEPHHMAVLTELASLYHSEDNLPQALHYYRLAMIIDPLNRRVRNLVESLTEKTGEAAAVDITEEDEYQDIEIPQPVSESDEAPTSETDEPVEGTTTLSDEPLEMDQPVDSEAAIISDDNIDAEEPDAVTVLEPEDSDTDFDVPEVSVSVDTSESVVSEQSTPAKEEASVFLATGPWISATFENDLPKFRQNISNAPEYFSTHVFENLLALSSSETQTEGFDDGQGAIAVEIDETPVYTEQDEAGEQDNESSFFIESPNIENEIDSFSLAPEADHTSVDQDFSMEDDQPESMDEEPDLLASESDRDDVGDNDSNEPEIIDISHGFPPVFGDTSGRDEEDFRPNPNLEPSVDDNPVELEAADDQTIDFNIESETRIDDDPAEAIESDDEIIDDNSEFQSSETIEFGSDVADRLEDSISTISSDDDTTDLSESVETEPDPQDQPTSENEEATTAPMADGDISDGIDDTFEADITEKGETLIFEEASDPLEDVPAEGAQEAALQDTPLESTDVEDAPISESVEVTAMPIAQVNYLDQFFRGKSPEDTARDSGDPAPEENQVEDINESDQETDNGPIAETTPEENIEAAEALSDESDSEQNAEEIAEGHEDKSQTAHDNVFEIKSTFGMPGLTEESHDSNPQQVSADGGVELDDKDTKMVEHGDEDRIDLTSGSSPLSDENTEQQEDTEDPQADAIPTATLAELYVRQGLTERAITVYLAMIEHDPTNPDIHKRLSELFVLKAEEERP